HLLLRLSSALGGLSFEPGTYYRRVVEQGCHSGRWDADQFQRSRILGQAHIVRVALGNARFIAIWLPQHTSLADEIAARTVKQDAIRPHPAAVRADQTVTSRIEQQAVPAPPILVGAVRGLLGNVVGRFLKRLPAAQRLELGRQPKSGVPE